MKRINNQRFKQILENYRDEAVQVLKQSEGEARGLDDNCPRDVGDLSVAGTSKEFLFQRSSEIRSLIWLIDASLT